jgi:hypothetical protein
MSFLFGTKSQDVVNGQTLDSVVNVNQNTVAVNTGVSMCSNTINIHNCDADGAKITQNATCLSSVTAYQNAAQAQTSSNTLSDELMNKLTQDTQNLSLNFTSEQQKLVNDLKINMSTDVQQSVLMDCFNGLSGINTINCDGGSMRNVNYDQSVATQGTLNCAQNSTQNSSTSQQLKASVSNIVSQKEENALWAMSACILAVGCVVAVVFLGPAADVSIVSKQLLKEPEGILMLTFVCLCYVASCDAMSVSNAHLLDLSITSNNKITIPPSMKQSSWDVIWIIMAIYAVVMIGFAYVEMKAKGMKAQTAS